MLVPHVLVLLTSVLSPDPQHLAVWPLTLDSWARVWEPLYAEVFLHSLWLSAVTTLVCLLLGYPFAYLLAKLPKLWRGVLLFLMIVPFWTNSLIRTYALKLLLGNKGVVNTALLGLGITDEPVELLYTEFAVIFGLVYVLLPFMVLPLYANLVKHDLSLLEAASDLGAKGYTAFWKITVPLSKSGVIAGCMLVFIPVVGEFVIPELLGGPETLMIGKVLWQEFFNNRDWPVAASLAVIMLLLLMIPIILFNRNQASELEGKA